MSVHFAKPVRELIEEFEKLPGIGPKSAARLAYYFLNAPEHRAIRLAEQLLYVKKMIVHCSVCFNLTDKQICDICADDLRSENQICVIEEPLDLIAIENSNIYHGKYHVLGGVISPISGIGPEDIRIDQLRKRLNELSLKQFQEIEIIIATNPTLEGEGTAYFIFEYIKDIPRVFISRIGRGLPTGANIEYADNITLRNSLENRKIIPR